MATTKKRRKKPAKTAKARSKKSTRDTSFSLEVMLWCVLAVSIVLFLSNLGIGGKVGGAVASFFFGVFGMMSYVFPILLFLATAFGVSNRRLAAGKRKLVAMIVLYLLLCGFIQMATNRTEDFLPGSAYLKGATSHTGGGVVGGVLEYLLRPNFGTAGAFTILIIAMIICLVLLTERSFLKGIKKGGKRLAESAQKTAADKYVQYKEYREEKRQAGVSLNTKLVPEEPEMPVISDTEELLDTTKETEVVRRDHVRVRPGEAAEELDAEEPPVPDDMSELIIKNANIFAEPEPEQAPEAPVIEPEEVPFVEEPPIPQEIAPVAPVPSAMEEIAPVQSAPSAPQEEAKPQPKKPVRRKYVFPDPKKLLTPADKSLAGDDEGHLRETAAKLQQTLESFGVKASVTNATCGPTVTRYELQPEIGVKVSKIVGLQDDIKLNLAAADIRIEAPIPGRSVIGIEVPNQKSVPVMFRDIILSDKMSKAKMPSLIAFGAGKDIGGEVMVADIAKMPHVLIAGATGSGKSVCINTIIMSILYRAHPDDVKLIMIDPKVVELSVYNGIPHLLRDVVTDPHEATMALNWAVAEMDRRYQLFAQINVRDLKGYNNRVEEVLSDPKIEETPEEKRPVKLPQLVVIVDELADLMMVASGDVEGAICRLAQLARACGIHLVIATQRPSVNVITGLIKANMPSRIAFAVTSGVDSRTILDMVGAEKLLGKGDMLYFPQGIPKPIRVQGAFVSDEEVRATVEFIKEHNGDFETDTSIEEEMKKAAPVRSGQTGGGSMTESSDGNERDPYFTESAKLIVDKEKASIGMLQRAFKIGFNRAARIMDQLEEAGVVGPEAGTKPRDILMTEEELNNYLEENG